MPWAWVRPTDAALLRGRPLLDLGTGDGQTLAALIDDRGGVVGLDRSLDSLRTARETGLRDLVAGLAEALPFADATFATVVAGDLIHHLDAQKLAESLREIARILRPGGRLLAWWYEQEGRPGPDSPRFPRPLGDVSVIARDAGFTRTSALDLTASIQPIPPTAGLLAEI